MWGEYTTTHIQIPFSSRENMVVWDWNESINQLWIQGKRLCLLAAAEACATIPLLLDVPAILQLCLHVSVWMFLKIWKVSANVLHKAPAFVYSSANELSSRSQPT